MRKVLLLFSVLILSITAGLSQTRQISGTVSNQKGETIPGVNVTIKGTTTSASTDANGTFRLNIPSTGNVTLVIRSLGFSAQEIAVGSRTQINVTLVEEAQQLEDVVVIGYATVARRDLNASVSSINARQLQDIPINSTAEALAGRLAGVQITQSEGSPNASAQIRVRGGGSITQDNSPLYIVDGIQVENALTNVAAQDIESIDVLKDASSTAIYGARGANGVVIITTKGGKEMKPTIAYSGLAGYRQLANKLEVMRPYDFVRYQYERARGNTTQEANFLNTYGTFQDLELYKQAPFVDWQDETFGRNALMQTHNISLAGGTRDTKYNLSITSNTEEGIMLISDFDRKLINFRFNQNISDKLRTEFNVRYNNTIVNGAGTASGGSSSTNRLRHSLRYRPLLLPGQELLDYDPAYADETASNSLSLVNPILLNEAEYRRNNNSTANFSGNFTYDLNKYLSFKSTLGFDISSDRENSFNDIITTIAKQNSNQPTADINAITRNTVNNSNVLTFNMNKSGSSFSDHNKLDILLGQELYQNKYRRLTTESRLFPVGINAERALGSMNLGTPVPTTSDEYIERLSSFFGRANYSFDNKYLLSVTMRADGSSKFAAVRRWGYFPSASFAWRLSDENFFKGLSSGISDLKLRASYGEAGNNRIGNFLFLTQFSTNGYYSINDQIISVYTPSSLSNNFLKWETTIARNIGADISFLNGRVQISADAYRNSTSDNLVEVTIPGSSGYQRQLQNVGSTLNKGIELQINGSPVVSKNFSWDTNFNISFNKNTIQSLGAFQNSFLISSGWAGSNQPSDYLVKVGESVGAIWGLQTDGFYTLNDFDYNNGVYTLKAGVPNNSGITSSQPQPGVLKFRDITNDGLVTDADRSIIGDTQPNFFGGFNQQLRYKNFDLNIFMNFQAGNDILNANKLEFTSGYTVNANMLALTNDRWRNVNDQGQVVTDPAALAALNSNATLWSPLTSASSFYVHSWAVENGSFLRLSNVTLGYNIPEGLLSKIKISKLRVYVTGNNLAVLTKYSGYDPEVNTRRSTPLTPGVDYSAYPRSRAFIFGLNLSL